MIEVRIATERDMDALLHIRLCMLRELHGLREDDAFDSAFLEATRAALRPGASVTAVAEEDGAIIGCATLCPLRLLPTWQHRSGRRGHIMNVYTSPAHRRRGAARRMLALLIAVAGEQGMTELSLDATEEGRPLYLSLGFVANGEGMVLPLNP